MSKHGSIIERKASTEAALRELLDGGLRKFPYEPLRTELYSPNELMEDYRRGEPESFFADSRDATIYKHYDARRKGIHPETIHETLAQAIHDHGINEALEVFLEATSAKPVAVMGGHAMKRTDATFADVAKLGHALCNQGFLVVTGGGPGAMEAANLGAALTKPDWQAVLARLAQAPNYEDPLWFETAYDVLEGAGELRENLAIPTWFYGHEPSNLFATHIAKFFSNALREEGLLAIATHGIVFAPGSAGTVQEIFQDAAQNHYVTYKVTSPMVLLGRDYWTQTLPAYPLLQKLSNGHAYARKLALLDTVDEAVAFIKANTTTA